MRELVRERGRGS